MKDEDGFPYNWRFDFKTIEGKIKFLISGAYIDYDINDDKKNNRVLKDSILKNALNGVISSEKKVEGKIKSIYSDIKNELKKITITKIPMKKSIEDEDDIIPTD